MLLDTLQSRVVLQTALRRRFAILAINADSPAAITDVLEAADPKVSGVFALLLGLARLRFGFAMDLRSDLTSRAAEYANPKGVPEFSFKCRIGYTQLTHRQIEIFTLL